MDGNSNKKVNSNDVRNRLHHLSDDIVSKISLNVGTVSSDIYEGCENCSNHPFDWTEYCGNVVEEYEEGKTDLITNKQLHFLAYSAYTSLRHGFLGKKKRVPIPHCMKCGLCLPFPEKK
jgi:hypothetical protein